MYCTRRLVSGKAVTLLLFYLYLPSVSLANISSNLRVNNMSTTSSSSIMTYVTCPTMEVAKELSRNIVTQKLAACVNIIPQITSIYEWEGKVEEDSEILMVIKTSRDQLSSLTSYVEEHHPYDVPEVIATEINGGSKKYIDWIIQQTLKK